MNLSALTTIVCIDDSACYLLTTHRAVTLQQQNRSQEQQLKVFAIMLINFVKLAFRWEATGVHNVLSS